MSSGSNRFTAKTTQSSVLQLDQCTNPEFNSFPEDRHPKNYCLDRKRVIRSVCSCTFYAENIIQEHLEDTDND